MALKDTITADLETIETDLGSQVMTWKSEEYVCVPGSHGAVATLEEGGFAGDADLIINVRKDLFTDEVYPNWQEKVTFASKVYRIITVRTDATDAFLRLFLANASRGV